MLLIVKYIHNCRHDVTMEEFCDGLTKHIAQQYENHNGNISRKSTECIWQHLVTHPEERLTASCVIYSRAKQQIWLIGDCQCLIDGRLYDNPKPCEASIAQQRAAVANEMLASGKATTESLCRDDTARRAIIPMLIKSMKAQNIDYPVVDGFPIPKHLVRVVFLESEHHTIVLASDGYPFLEPTLDASEKRLAMQLKSDPLNIGTFKATKAFMNGNNSFDDRAYIRFDVLVS